MPDVDKFWFKNLINPGLPSLASRRKMFVEPDSIKVGKRSYSRTAITKLKKNILSSDW